MKNLRKLFRKSTKIIKVIHEKLAEYDEVREKNSEIEGMLNSALVHVFNPLEVQSHARMLRAFSQHSWAKNYIDTD